MPGLAGGTFRIIHTFLVPLYGTRRIVSLSTASLLLPLAGWFFAVQHSGTPYWVLLVLAFLAGLGGGNFSSFMPSTSLFFPKRLQGTALGIQAGIGTSASASSSS
jgi:NNP family nitrate/nitrite transporter-like MFS transporter